MKTSTTNNDVSTNKKISELNELQTRIDAVTAESCNVGIFIRDKEREKEALERNLDVFTQECKDRYQGYDLSTRELHIQGYFDESRLNREDKERLLSLRSKIVDVKKELVDAREKQDVLQDQEASLLSSMATMNANYAFDCLLYLQKKQNETEQKVAVIREAIATQKKNIEQSESTCQPSISEVTQKHEEMLADVALGIIPKNELAAVEEQLKKVAGTVAESTDKLNDILSLTQKTIAGLERKLAVAEKELDVATFAMISAEKRFLHSEAEKTGKEYARATSLLTTNFRRLLALNSIMVAKEYPNIEADDTRRFYVPTFALHSHNGIGNHEASIVEQAAHYHFLEDDIQHEIELFAKSGIIIK